MHVFIVGGTGLLGYASALELIRRGNKVSALALPPLPQGLTIPPEMKIVFGNYIDMTDDALKAQMTGCDALVFAAGIDERVEFPSPVYDAYHKYNIEPVKRFLRISKEIGIQKAVIMGSYFTHFDKIWPELRLAEKHPYIRSRREQERTALNFNSEKMAVMVLELPYIFGTQPGRKPVRTFLIETIKKMKFATFFMKGGTTMVTVNQVAQAVAGALERPEGGTSYPVGWYNMTWKELFAVFHKHMGIPKRKFLTLPNWLVRLGAVQLK